MCVLTVCCVCAGHPSPASVPSEASGGAGQTQTDAAQSALQELLPLGAGGLLQPVHQHLPAQPHRQVHFTSHAHVFRDWPIIAFTGVFFTDFFYYTQKDATGRTKATLN